MDACVFTMCFSIFFISKENPQIKLFASAPHHPMQALPNPSLAVWHDIPQRGTNKITWVHKEKHILLINVDGIWNGLYMLGYPSHSIVGDSMNHMNPINIFHYIGWLIEIPFDGTTTQRSTQPPLYLIEPTRVFFSLLTCGTPKATSLCWGRKVKKK